MGTACHEAKRALARWSRARAGSAAVEFVAVAPLYFALLLAAFQMAMIFIAQDYLETVAQSGARLVLTNQANAMTRSQFAAAICADVAALFNCGNLIVSLQPAPASASAMATAMPQFDATGALQGSTPFAISAAPSKMMLVVMYPWPVIGAPLGFNVGNLGNGCYLMVSTQIFQIEPPTNS